MSSILTNNSAMVALQTMKSINKNMATTQSEISTGKSVASSKDNAAVWAISKSMESDVSSFKSISDSLNLGSSTIAVARQASETVTDLLTQMKTKIVAAQESNVDRGKIQTDVAALKSQIDSVVGAAQFNGLNMVNTTGSVDILSSLDRSSGGVAAAHITVGKQDLSTGGYTAKAAFAAGATASGTVSNAKDSFVATVKKDSGSASIKIDNTAGFAAGDKISLSIGDKTASYTVTADDVSTGNTPSELIAAGLKSAVDSLGIDGLTVGYDVGKPGELSFVTGTGSAAASKDLNITGQFANAGSGGLAALTGLDVSTSVGAQSALGAIEGLLTTAISAASSFGSAQSRIETQTSFVAKLSDSLKSGIGSMVDADMEATSARLQALQVQQQLATQSLSIANQQPQNILSLFR